MIQALPRQRRWLAYGLFCLLDHGCWLLIHLLPAPLVIRLARLRPWQHWLNPLPPARRELWKGRILWLLKQRCRRAGRFSTCLSRALSGRLLLDGIGVANDLHLGMNRGSEGRRIPHAWLQDPASGRLFTPGLSEGAGAPLTQL
ncbi:MAG: lasso peptide biosynthesis protein [Cyanobacteriota bacterium]|nr:lasso peptide biosynthesis protein [Cyanobacteriota bacterium]